MPAFWTFFAAAVILGWLGCICYYVAVWRLVKVGIHVKFLATPKDVFRVLRQYQNLASENAWSLWPIHGYWFFSIPALCAGVAAALCFYSSSSPEDLLPARLPNMSASLLWVACSSFIVAAVFSIRFFRYVSRQNIKMGAWKAWIHDEFSRNDFFLAMLGWSGFALATLMLILKRNLIR